MIPSFRKLLPWIPWGLTLYPGCITTIFLLHQPLFSFQRIARNSLFHTPFSSLFTFFSSLHPFPDVSGYEKCTALILTSLLSFRPTWRFLPRTPPNPQFLWLRNFLCMIYQILLIHHYFPSNSGFNPEHHMRLSLLTHPHIQRTTMFFLLCFLQDSQTLHSTTSSSYLHTCAVVSYLLSPWLCSPSPSAVYMHWQSEFS